MKTANAEQCDGFHVMIGNARAQAAVMVMAPGEQEGGPDNRHSGADQWLYVIDGSGEASVKQQRISLLPGLLLLIEAGESHQIRNTGAGPLKTLNIYTPPAYDMDGEELPAGRG